MVTKNIKLLDCTLRDGGYVNDWNFGESTISCVFERLVNAGIDVIEIGFLDDRRPFDPNRTIQPNTKCYDEMFAGCDKGDSMVVAMIDYGTCDISNIGPCEESFLDGIRIIFKKPKMKGAVEYARQIKEKGYKVFLQLVSITAYEDRDMLDLIDLANEAGVYAVSMVDTYGLMHKDDMLHYFNLLNKNLHPDMIIGYHSHNNFQLGYANEIEMIQQKTMRTLSVDGTVYGMGKSAGNAPLELLALYLNENCGTGYDMDQILEIIDVNIMRIYKEHYWGYSLLFYLAASNDCHPNYISYLLDKHTLSVKAINDIAGSIEKVKKLDYDKVYIEQLYQHYQEQTLFESGNLETLKAELSGKCILLLGPGRSLVTEDDRIKEYIADHAPAVISVNCVPKSYSPDYVFIGNAKRYSMLFRAFKNLQETCKVIATSNISSVGKPFDYVFSYDSVCGEDSMLSDNALVMVIKTMMMADCSEVTLAGFDGFSQQSVENYYDEYMDFTADYDQLSKVNEKIKEFIRTLDGQIKINFLTASKYER